MPEPLTTGLVAELLPKLFAAFPSKMASQNLTYTADVYRNGLSGLDGDAVRAAVDICIKTDSYFPKVARLRELSSEWTRRNRAVAVAKVAAAWNVCPVCGARAEQKPITRSIRDAAGKIVGTETVTSQGLYMDHDPVAHHVFKQDSEGVA